MRHQLKPLAYMRYGDDFILVCKTKLEADEFQRLGTQYLTEQLSLNIHDTNNHVVRARHGIKYLGVWLYPSGKSLPKSSLNTIVKRLNLENIASYTALFSHFADNRQKALLEDMTLKIHSETSHFPYTGE